MTNSKLLTHHIKAMGMPFLVKIVVPVGRNFRAEKLLQDLTQYLQRIDRDFSFRPSSLVCQFQRGELAAMDFTSEFQEVYGIASQAQKITGGAFDPFFDGTYDPTGIVKGWAIQRAFTRYLQPLLTNETLAAAAINGAGDIQVGISETTDFRWQVGVEDPQDRQQLLARYQLGSGAMATSGTSQHGEHIVRQGSQCQLQQATVLADELITADVWATAAIALGAARFNRLTNNQFSTILVDQTDRIVHE